MRLAVFATAIAAAVVAAAARFPHRIPDRRSRAVGRLAAVPLGCLVGLLVAAGAPSPADARAAANVRVLLSSSTVAAGRQVEVTLQVPRRHARAACRISTPRGLVASPVRRHRAVVRVRASARPGRYVLTVWCGAARGQRSLSVRAPAPCTFSAAMPASMELLGRARFPVRCDSVMLARLADRPGAPWQVVSRGNAFIDLALPGPGRWEVSVVDDGHPRGGPSQIVSVAAPACATTTTYRHEGGTVSECVLAGAPWPEAQRPSKYLLQWRGDRPLGTVTASQVAVYFHGDGGCCFDGYKRGVGALAMSRDMLVVNAIAPVSHQGSVEPAWGATFASTGSAQLGYDVGYDLRQIGGAVGTNRFLYWSDSGGSWFLSSNFIPTGLRYAPGPLALNCGGARPEPSLAGATAPEVKQASPVRFSWGSQDFLAGSIRDAIATYNKTGWSVSTDERPGEGHCQPDFGPANVAWFNSVL